MKHSQKGFAHLLLFLIIIAVILAISFVGWRVISSKTNPNQAQSGGTKDAPAPLKSIGFKLDTYDPNTGMAGDFRFTQQLVQVLTGNPIYQKMIWTDFGLQDVRSPNDPTKRNVQPTFRLPLGTKVLAPIDGEVVKVEKIYSGDYTIWFARSQSDTWSYETEHVNKPLVKQGDRVTAGQVVAEVSTHDSQHHPGFGILEIGLFHPVNSQPTHWCPFAYLDSSVKDEINSKINGLYKAWEDYIGDPNIYNQESYPTPGCASLDPAAG